MEHSQQRTKTEKEPIMAKGPDVMGKIKSMFSVGEEAVIPFVDDAVKWLVSSMGLKGVATGVLGAIVKMLFSGIHLDSRLWDSALRQLGESLAGNGVAAEISPASTAKFERNLYIAVEYGGVEPPTTRDKEVQPINPLGGGRAQQRGPMMLKVQILPDDEILEKLRKGREQRQEWMNALLSKVGALINHAEYDVRCAGNELLKILHGTGPYWLLAIAKEEFESSNTATAEMIQRAANYQAVKALLFEKPMIKVPEFISGHLVFRSVEQAQEQYARFDKDISQLEEILKEMVDKPWSRGDSTDGKFEDTRPMREKIAGAVVGNNTVRGASVSGLLLGAGVILLLVTWVALLLIFKR